MSSGPLRDRPRTYARGSLTLDLPMAFCSMAAYPAIPLRSKPMIRFCIALMAGLFVAGCATGPARDAFFTEAIELSPEPAFEISYSGEIGKPGAEMLIAAGEDFQSGPEDNLIAVEARILRVSLDAARALGLHDVGAFSLDAQDAGTPIAELRARRDGSIVTAPRLTIYERQTGTISVLNEVSYISGFQITENESARVVDPVIEIVRDGIKLQVKAARAGETIHLSLDLAVVELIRPIATHNVEVFNQRLMVQTPQVYRQSIQCTGEVKPGRTLALSGMTSREGEALLVLLNVTPRE